MARIPEKSPRYRSKSQICEDLAHVLNTTVSWGTQHAVIAEALWVWSEFDGKYQGCKNWSEGAWAARLNTKVLRHDHAVPKKILIEHLTKLIGKATSNSVCEILERLCIGVVITKDEDELLTRQGLRSKLPDGKLDPWSRYRRAGIIIRRACDSSAA